jgi:cyclohexadienyl dehydratase
MRYLLAVLLLVFSFNAPTNVWAKDSDYPAYDRVVAKNEIVCGIVSWPPYKYINLKTGEWEGFAVDLYRKAFATLDLKVTFKEAIIGTQVQDLNVGKFDAICDEGPWTMSAGKFVEFSDPAYAAPVYPYVRLDEKRFGKRADLNNSAVKFTGIDGDLSTDLVQRLFPKANITTMPNTTDMSQLFLNVATKKVDVAIVDPSAFSAYNKNNPNQLKPLFPDKPLGVYKVGVSVKKGDVKMLGLVNQAIDNAHSFGITDEVLDSFDSKHQKLKRVRSKFE